MPLTAPDWQDIPETVVRKLIRAVSGNKGMNSVTPEQRQAVRDAIIATKQDGQSLTVWRARAVGKLKRLGYVLHG